MYTADTQLLSISETYFEFEGVLFVVIFVVMKAAKTNYKLCTLSLKKREPLYVTQHYNEILFTVDML